MTQQQFEALKKGDIVFRFAEVGGLEISVSEFLPFSHIEGDYAVFKNGLRAEQILSEKLTQTLFLGPDKRRVDYIVAGDELGAEDFCKAIFQDQILKYRGKMERLETKAKTPLSLLKGTAFK